MKLSGSRIALLTVTALINADAWSQQDKNAGVSGKEWAQQFANFKERERFTPEKIYEPRYPNGTCPPEYSRNRTLMEEFLSGESSTKVRQQYGAPLPDSISDLEILNTKEDPEACRYFNKRYEERINLQYKICEDGMAWYLWDYTYFKSEVFYFVVRSGGKLRVDDPERPGCSRGIDSIGYGPPVVIYLRDDFSLVPLVPFWN